MKKQSKDHPDKPVEAIVTPIKKAPKTNMTIPGEENVKIAKSFVEENQK